MDLIFDWMSIVELCSYNEPLHQTLAVTAKGGLTEKHCTTCSIPDRSAAMVQLPLTNSTILSVYVKRCVVTTLLRYVWSSVESQSHGW